MNTPQTPRKIVLVLRLAYASQRDILHGISGAASPRGSWRFHVVDYAADPDGTLGRAALKSGADGVVVIASAVASESVSSWLCRWEGPLVEIGSHSVAVPGRSAPFSTVGIDDVSVCTANDAEVGVFAHGGASGLVGWLRAMQRPAAVMAVHDAAALDVLAAAEAGLHVPDDLAVLGVDNDESLCEMASPTLTSLAPDHVRLGRLAAEALRRRMERPDAPNDEFRIAGATVVARQSTRPVNPGVALAERAMAFIRRNATRGIGAADVVEHLGVSRTLAGLRFHQVHGETILAEILRVRLEEARRRLAETDAPVSKVAASCGFRSPKHAMRLFKAHFHCTMREWRRRGGNDAPASGRNQMGAQRRPLVCRFAFREDGWYPWRHARHGSAPPPHRPCAPSPATRATSRSFAAAGASTSTRRHSFIDSSQTSRPTATSSRARADSASRS